MSKDHVNIITTVYSGITDAAEMEQYVRDRVSQGRDSDIYAVPNIPDAVYNKGTDAADAIQTAIDKHALNPSIPNTKTIKNKIALAVKWLDGLVLLVVPIANSETNCSTLEEAATNITIIGFTPEKLYYSKKGTPDTINFTAEYVGNGIIEIEIIMPDDFKPTTITVVAVAVPPVTNPPTALPSVKLIGAQVQIKAKVFVESFTKTITGKGKSLKLYAMDSCPSWIIYMYCQNGNMQISLLSAGVRVNLINPTAF